MTREQILNEIENLIGRIGQTDFDNENYQKYQDELKKWQDILACFDESEKAEKNEEKNEKKDKRNRRFEMFKTSVDLAKTTIAIGGTLLGIVLIISAEESVPKILTSKSMSFVTKMLPKVV